jgi:aspartyl/asparaginyl-tRNA synthetase
MVEVAAQHKLSILASCEQPESIAIFNYAGHKWPLSQTTQMHLEFELLKNPKPYGYFSIGTSYRNEQNPIPGRHELIFPMFEFEHHGGFNELVKFEHELIRSIGYNGKIDGGEYKDVAKKYNTVDISHEHEQHIYKSGSPVFMLRNFPIETNAFWNMARYPDGTAQKIDVIMSGLETIGSATRSCNPDEMRRLFKTMSNGEYAGLLYKHFGEKRVNDELEEFLSLKFINRSGGGIGMSRLMNFFEKEKLYPKEVEDMSRVD